MERSQVINFGAGPSCLPLSVLEEAAKGLIDYNGTGMGITELSHRSKEFSALVDNLETLIRELLEVPSTHSIAFTQGGGTGQFSAVVLNLLARHHLLHPNVSDRVMDYVVTGSWSKKAYEEAQRLGGGKANVVVDSREHSVDGKSFDNIPHREHWKLSNKPAFVYYCENETVDGVQFTDDPSSPFSFPFDLVDPDVPIVADYSSSFLSRPIPNLISHALIYAGAQKNLAPSGLAILIIRKDLLVDVDAAAKFGAAPVPITMSYKTLVDSRSLYHTPPMFSMYVAGLVLERMKAEGGIILREVANRNKARKVYDAVKEGEKKGTFKLRVQENGRSWMNVTFAITGEDNEKRFLAGAESRGMKQLKGHRSVGGIRVSLYNGVTEEQVDALVSYIHDFLDASTL